MIGYCPFCNRKMRANDYSETCRCPWCGEYFNIEYLFTKPKNNDSTGDDKR